MATLERRRLLATGNKLDHNKQLTCPIFAAHLMLHCALEQSDACIMCIDIVARQLPVINGLAATRWGQAPSRWSIYSEFVLLIMRVWCLCVLMFTGVLGMEMKILNRISVQ